MTALGDYLDYQPNAWQGSVWYSHDVTWILVSRTFFRSVWHIHVFPSPVIWNYALHPLWQPQALSPVLAPPPQQVHWPYRKLLTMYEIKREEGERVGEYGIRIALTPSRVRRIYLEVMNACNSSPTNRLFCLQLLASTRTVFTFWSHSSETACSLLWQTVLLLPPWGWSRLHHVCLSIVLVFQCTFRKS